MRIKFCAIAILVLTMMTSPVWGGKASANRADYLDDLRSYATCTVRNNHDSARKLILANVDNKTMERKFGDLYTSKPLTFVTSCRELILQARSIIIQPDAFRAAVADILVGKEFGQGPAADFAGLVPLVHLQPESNAMYQAKLSAAKFAKQRHLMKKMHDESVSRSWLSVYGECVVRKDPITARAWLASKPGSSGEFAAISGMQPALGHCLVQGEALTFDRHTLRGTLAINYYRLAMAKLASSAGSAK